MPMAAGAGLSAAVLSVHTMPWTDDPNRWGGAIWALARHTPSVLEVPASFWILFPLGAVVLTMIGQTQRKSSHGLLLICVGLWLIANLASARAYQKYYDPFVLFVLGLSIQTLPTPSRRAWIGPGVLIAALAMVDLVRFYR